MRAAHLEYISFHLKHIGPGGLLALTKAKWIQISIINLGNYISKKITITLETKNAIIWPSLTIIWPLLTSVLNI